MLNVLNRSSTSHGKNNSHTVLQMTANCQSIAMSNREMDYNAKYDVNSQVSGLFSQSKKAVLSTPSTLQASKVAAATSRKREILLSDDSCSDLMLRIVF